MNECSNKGIIIVSVIAAISTVLLIALLATIYCWLKDFRVMRSAVNDDKLKNNLDFSDLTFANLANVSRNQNPTRAD